MISGIYEYLKAVPCNPGPGIEGAPPRKTPVIESAGVWHCVKSNTMRHFIAGAGGGVDGRRSKSESGEGFLGGS